MVNLQLVVLAVALGLTLPLIGVFIVLRRNALFTDAFAHVILLGIALAVALKINVVLGIFGFAFLAALGLFLVREKALLHLDAIVGVFFTTSLALAAFIIPSEELLEAFLGDLGKISSLDVWLAAGVALIILAALLGRFRQFAYVSFASDLAHVDKLPVKRTEFFFTLLLAAGIAVSVKVTGTLLVSALAIIPAATAKMFSRGLRAMTGWSVFFGFAALFAGLYAAQILQISSGSAITLAAAILFVVTFIWQILFRHSS